MTFKMIFSILFLLHLVSGAVNRHLGINIGGFSIIGFLNITAIGFFILCLSIPKFIRNLRKTRHIYVIIIFLYILGCIPSLVLHPELRSLIAFSTYIFTLVSVYYMGQVFWLQLKRPEQVIAFILKVFFTFIAFVGLLHAIDIGFNYTVARNENHSFSFLLFEYPHSAGIVISTLTPLYFRYIISGRINRIHLLNIYFILPVVLVFSGALIAILTYCVSISLSIIYTYIRSIKGVILAILIFSGAGMAFLNSPVYESLIKISDIPLSTYLSDTGTHSINSFHTRIKVWEFMTEQTIVNHRLLGGAGWREWALSYEKKAGYGSAQSDYFTLLFDAGIPGLIGFILYRILGILVILNDSVKERPESVYLAIGVTAGLFLGSFSETVEGYASTSWLFPVILSVSHYYKHSIKIITNGFLDYWILRTQDNYTYLEQNKYLTEMVRTK